MVSLRHHDKQLLVAEEQASGQSLSNDVPFTLQTSIDESSGAFRLCTWNLLAPCYFRASTGKEVTTIFWRPRIEAQFYVAFEVIKPDIMCFQELWFSPTVLSILGEAAKQHDYQLVTCRRPGMKQDGVCILARRSVFTVEASQEMEICAVGDRVALWVLLHGCTSECQPLIVGTTHFSFPHGDADDQRYLQAKRAMNGCYKFAEDKGLNPHNAPLVLAGDLNCETTVAADEAVGVLLNEGWRSTFAEANGKDAHATHITHRNTHSCADLILLRGAASAGSASLLPAQDPDTSSIPRPQVGGAQHLSGSSTPVLMVLCPQEGGRVFQCWISSVILLNRSFDHP